MKSFFYKLYLFGRTSEAVRQSAILTFTTAFTGVVMGLAFILLSRTLGPDKFGVFSVSLALMGILMRVPDLGLSQVMIKMLGNWRQDSSRRNEFLGQVVLWKMQLSLLLMIVGTLAIPFISRILNYPFYGLIFLTIIGSILIVVYEYVYVVLSSEHKFFWVGLLGIFQALLKFLGFLTLILLGVSEVLPGALIYFIAPFLAAVIMLVRFKNIFTLKAASASKSLIQSIKPFAIHAAVGTLAMTLIANVDVLFVQSNLSSFETGLYSGATRIAVFIGFISSALGGVLNNRVSRYTDLDTISLYLKKVSLIVLASILGFIVFVPFSQFIILWTIGEAYLGASVPLIILVLNAFLSLATVPFISIFYAVDKPSYFSVGGIIQVLIIVLGNWLFIRDYGISATAWTRVVATSVFALYTLFHVWRLFKTKEKNE